MRKLPNRSVALLPISLLFHSILPSQTNKLASRQYCECDTMKIIQKLRFFSTPFLYSPPSAAISLHHFSSSTQTEIEDPAPKSSVTLTHEEITKINLLIPRLCSTNHLKEATGLITTALLTNPPLKSLPLSIFIQRLSEEPDLTQSMYFLNKMKYSPKIQPFLKPIMRMLVYYYFQKGQPKWALKIFHWVSRSDFPREGVDVGFYSLLINGFCKYNMVLEALIVLRVILSESLVVEDEVRALVYRGLLREARIKDAQELNKALESVGSGNDGNKTLMEMLDHMISNWVE